MFGKDILLIGGNMADLEALAAADVANRLPLHKEFPTQEVVEECDCGNCDQSAVGMLEEAGYCIGDRASERDTEEERSMAATVRAFNGMFGTELTEEQGWWFMNFLKCARAKGGDYRRDDYVDAAAYAALAGECRADS